MKLTPMSLWLETSAVLLMEAQCGGTFRDTADFSVMEVARKVSSESGA